MTNAQLLALLQAHRTTGHPLNAVMPLPGFAAFFSGVNARGLPTGSGSRLWSIGSSISARGLSEKDRYDAAQLAPSCARVLRSSSPAATRT